MQEPYSVNELLAHQWLAYLQETVHEIAKSKGWWDEERSTGEVIALIHSELSEALQALREKEEPHSDHIPDFLLVEEEMADVIIRVLDFCAGFGYNVCGALIEKVRYNRTREYRHGKLF